MMGDWFHDLPVLWVALTVFGVTYVIAIAIYKIVTILAVGERLHAFKAVSPGLLPSLALLFGLFVAFTANQVWNDIAQAATAVNREAEALGAVMMLSTGFPGDAGDRIRGLTRAYIEEVARNEWPLMARHAEKIDPARPVLAELLQLTLTLTPQNQGQEVAQRRITTALENVSDARQQRIVISHSQVNPAKWLCLAVQAICTLIAIAMLHSDNWRASVIAMGLFATGIAASIFLIASHNRPFTGEISVGPAPLLEVLSEEKISIKR
jgi:ABC-type multidrug transport system fused ATPase/permease subunit